MQAQPNPLSPLPPDMVASSQQQKQSLAVQDLTGGEAPSAAAAQPSSSASAPPPPPVPSFSSSSMPPSSGPSAVNPALSRPSSSSLGRRRIIIKAPSAALSKPVAAPTSNATLSEAHAGGETARGAVSDAGRGQPSPGLSNRFSPSAKDPDAVAGSSFNAVPSSSSSSLPRPSSGNNLPTTLGYAQNISSQIRGSFSGDNAGSRGGGAGPSSGPLYDAEQQRSLQQQQQQQRQQQPDPLKSNQQQQPPANGPEQTLYASTHLAQDEAVLAHFDESYRRAMENMKGLIRQRTQYEANHHQQSASVLGLVQQLLDLQHRYQAKLIENEDLEHSHKKQLETLDSAFVDARRKLLDQIKRVTSELDHQKAESATLIRNLRETTTTVNAAKKVVDYLKEEKKSWETARAVLNERVQVAQDESKDWKKQLDMSQQDLRDQLKKVGELTTAQTTLGESLVAVNKEMTVLVTARETDAVALESTKKELEEIKASRDAEVERIWKEKREQLEAEVKGLREKEEGTRKELDAIKAEHEPLKQEWAELIDHQSSFKAKEALLIEEKDREAAKVEELKKENRFIADALEKQKEMTQYESEKKGQVMAAHRKDKTQLNQLKVQCEELKDFIEKNRIKEEDSDSESSSGWTSALPRQPSASSSSASARPGPSSASAATPSSNTSPGTPPSHQTSAFEPPQPTSTPFPAAPFTSPSNSAAATSPAPNAFTPPPLFGSSTTNQIVPAKRTNPLTEETPARPPPLLPTTPRDREKSSLSTSSPNWPVASAVPGHVKHGAKPIKPRRTSSGGLSSLGKEVIVIDVDDSRSASSASPSGGGARGAFGRPASQSSKPSRKSGSDNVWSSHGPPVGISKPSFDSWQNASSSNHGFLARPRPVAGQTTTSSPNSNGQSSKAPREIRPQKLAPRTSTSTKPASLSTTASSSKPPSSFSSKPTSTSNLSSSKSNGPWDPVRINASRLGAAPVVAPKPSGTGFAERLQALKDQSSSLSSQKRPRESNGAEPLPAKKKAVLLESSPESDGGGSNLSRASSTSSMSSVLTKAAKKPRPEDLPFMNGCPPFTQIEQRWTYKTYWADRAFPSRDDAGPVCDAWCVRDASLSASLTFVPSMTPAPTSRFVVAPTSHHENRKLPLEVQRTDHQLAARVQAPPDATTRDVTDLRLEHLKDQHREQFNRIMSEKGVTKKGK